MLYGLAEKLMGHEPQARSLWQIQEPTAQREHR